MLSAEDVLKVLAANPHVMGVLGGGACAIQHVSTRVANGPDKRLDACPCDRQVDVGDVINLGGGQYVSSETHTLADLVRDVMGD